MARNGRAARCRTRKIFSGRAADVPVDSRFGWQIYKSRKVLTAHSLFGNVSHYVLADMLRPGGTQACPELHVVDERWCIAFHHCHFGQAVLRHSRCTSNVGGNALNAIQQVRSSFRVDITDRELEPRLSAFPKRASLTTMEIGGLPATRLFVGNVPDITASVGSP